MGIWSALSGTKNAVDYGNTNHAVRADHKAAAVKVSKSGVVRGQRSVGNGGK